MNLFDLSDAQRKVLDGIAVVDAETGEYYDSENISELEGRIEDKIDAIACYIKEVDSDADAMKAEEQRIAKRRKAAEVRSDRLRQYLMAWMQESGRRKAETARSCVSLRRAESVKVYDDLALPDGFMRQRIENVPDKKAIKAAIKAGEQVPGAEIVSYDSMVIA